MSGQTEDVSYNTPDFATPERENKPDPDQPNKSVLLTIFKYLNEQMAKHNSFEVIKPEAEGVMTTQQQVLVHKEVVAHLNNIRVEIINKIKELK